ncbi:MAG: hypothetical protein WC028_14090 [Candidatus Obscuribacterales bacterium]|jgi:hypothetical protein
MVSPDKEEELVTWFIISLGASLSLLEKSKERLLTEDEILKHRDEAPCIMVTMEAADKMKASRGYEDIDPENVLVDWQRRRIEFVETYWPCLVFYVLTKDSATKKCCDLLESKGIDYQIEERDEALPALITSYASYYNPMMEAKERESLTTHTNYLIVRSKPFKSSEAEDTTKAFLPLVSELFDIGALGISLESSSIMHSKGAWKLFAEELEKNPLASMLCAFVQMPVSIEGAYMSVGMQSLGQADYIIETKTLKALGHRDKAEELSIAANDLFQSLAFYQLGECPANGFLSGNTFSLTADSPRLRVRIEPCKFFQESDIRYNPFGVWRLSLK